ncbi:transcriptional regulator [Streptomyces inusitatus]|uniref:Transcriptional regulator n=1 Tax=Streptomyces inusitatus TaxID=68221 RepID=A0A918UKN0_9ACTN|nr:helix-turn-helix domain-containing protein [Streptomyces inusitatus]GGZ16746.1 transcriptional regulator [Streptomyces inusitatus]
MATGTSATVPTLIGSVQRALRLLEAVACHPEGAPAKQLARETSIPLPTAYHLLRTLTHEDYLRREKGLFLLGGAVGRLALGESAQNRRGELDRTLEHWRDAIGAPVYLAFYREGEIELVGCADSPYAPAVEEWADFRETGHAHAIGQCLLSRLDPRARGDHLDRHPVRPVTPHSVRDRRTLLERLAAAGRGPVVERQEYALGTVCAAVPVTVGSGTGAVAAAMAISLPLHQEARLLPAVEQLRKGVGGLPGALALSISI